MSFSSSEIIGSLKKNPVSVICSVLALALAGFAYFRLGGAAALQTELDEKSAEAAKLFAAAAVAAGTLTPSEQARLGQRTHVQRGLAGQ